MWLLCGSGTARSVRRRREVGADNRKGHLALTQHNTWTSRGGEVRIEVWTFLLILALMFPSFKIQAVGDAIFSHEA